MVDGFFFFLIWHVSVNCRSVEKIRLCTSLNHEFLHKWSFQNPQSWCLKFCTHQHLSFQCLKLDKGWRLTSWTGFGRPCSLCMAFFGLSKDIFEILRVLALWRHQKIKNWLKFGRATAQNVKVVKNNFGSSVNKILQFFEKTDETKMDYFYVSGCNFVKSWSISDFLLSPES